MKCGLCLPHCPTYTLSRHEGDSPRGRIALMQGLAQGVIEPEGSALPHLDGCLVCRACETVCPAQVPYGRLIDRGRAGLWRSGHRPGWLWRVLAFLRRTPRRLAWLTRVIRVARASGFAPLVAHLPFGSVSRVMKFVEKTGTPPATGIHPSAPPGETVALFLGCIARSLDSAALHATVRVLNRMGYSVDVTPAQTCCGAMDAHAGDTQTAEELAQRNITAFADDIPVITVASGCGVQLKDCDEVAGLDATRSKAFAARVHDVMHFIATNAERLPPLASLDARVIVHEPCTLRNGMREGGTLDVLKRIPGLAVASLRHKDCCGAAGSYLFEHADSADRLGERLLDSLGDDVPDVFVTGNIGCALHVRRLARKRCLRMVVRHPVELLAACLETSGKRAAL